VPGRRRAPDGGPRAHDDLDSAEVLGGAGGRVHQGEERPHLARVYGERKRNFVGQNFWARGYFVSTVGRDETMVREYIRNQEEEDKRLENLKLW
jgi:REP element-mobilizing transposase RayT